MTGRIAWLSGRLKWRGAHGLFIPMILGLDISHISWKISLIPVLLIVSVAIFVWAAFIRRPEKKHSHPHPWRAPKPAPISEKKGWRSPFRKRHRRRRKERPRNPTLAETGGLPALRSPNQPRPKDP